MGKNSKDKSFQDQNSLPCTSEHQGELNPDSFLALANEYIAHEGSTEQSADIFYNRIEETLKNEPFADIQIYVEKFNDLTRLHPKDRRIRIIHVKTLLAVCRAKGWNESSQERFEVQMNLRLISHHDLVGDDCKIINVMNIINTIPEEKMLVLEYGNFCLSQYSKITAGAENAASVYNDLQEIQFEVAKLVDISKGKEEILSIYSQVLAEKIKSFDLNRIEKITKKLRGPDKSLNSNPIIHLAHMKSTFLTFSKLMDAATNKSLFRKTETDFDLANVFADLLTNILLTEEVCDLHYFHECIFQYLHEKTESEINVSEYAGMIEFLSIGASADDLAVLVTLGSQLLYTFPTNESVATAHAYILLKRMKFLPPEGIKAYRNRIIELICNHPQNQEIKAIFAVEFDVIASKLSLSDMLERKMEIETSLSQFLDCDKRLIKLYVFLLLSITELQTVSAANRTMEVMEKFAEKHKENSDVDRVYEAMKKKIVCKIVNSFKIDKY